MNSLYFFQKGEVVKLKTLFLSVLLVSIMSSNYAYSSAYIGTQDKQLHYDLQTLVEWGYVDATMTTYPVPWKGVAQSIQDIDPDGMDFRPQQAYLRLKHYLTLHKRGVKRKYLSLQAASDNVRFRSFDDGVEDTGKVTIATEFYLGRISGQMSVNYAAGGEKTLDNSFIAYQFGDWNLRLGALDQWWGPGQSSSLIMSNNTRPIKALAFSRSTNTKSKNPWLAWMGPWFLTSQIGQLEKNRTVSNTKMLMNRFNARPIEGLEIGLSWTAMWGGDGYQQDLEAVFDVLTFEGECEPPSSLCSNLDDNTKSGNYLAGIDISYTMQMLNRPWTLYLQRIGEDSVNVYDIRDNANLFGVSTYWKGAKLFVETSDTNIACSGTSPSNNCYYESDSYPDGYRMYGRAIGSTFDSDAKQLTLGANIRFKGGDMAEVYLRHAQLNKDGENPTSVLTQGVSEDLLEVSGFYQQPMGNWLLKAGGSIINRKYESEDDEVDALLYLKAQYAF